MRVFFWVEDVNGLYDDVLGCGAEIEIPLEDRPYRIHDFAIRDPNEVLLVFGQDGY